jgi:hypothetical protein
MDEKEALDRLQFLHERRTILFNTRRDHEWKILFGVIGLFIATDAAQVAYGIQLASWYRCAWDLAVAGLSVACFCYEWGLQTRNLRDRRAMNTLNNRLCRSVGLPESDPAFEYEQLSRRSSFGRFSRR